MPGFAVIVLAAGGSSRLGQPKQLVVYVGEPLVRRATRTAVESGAEQVIVVLGAHAEAVRKSLDGLVVKTVVNANWQLGLGSSIRCGAEALSPGITAVVLSLCDMPLVTRDLLRELAEAVADGDPPIAAAEYNCHLGVPCAFHSSRFPALRELSGDKGARDLVRTAPRVARFTFQAWKYSCDTRSSQSLYAARVRVAQRLNITVKEFLCSSPPPDPVSTFRNTYLFW